MGKHKKLNKKCENNKQIISQVSNMVMMFGMVVSELISLLCDTATFYSNQPNDTFRGTLYILCLTSSVSLIIDEFFCTPTSRTHSIISSFVKVPLIIGAAFSFLGILISIAQNYVILGQWLFIFRIFIIVCFFISVIGYALKVYILCYDIQKGKKNV